MKRLLVVVIALASCTPAPPEPVVAKKLPPKTAPAPEKKPAAPEPAAVTPAPVPPAPVPPAPKPPPPPVSKPDSELVLKPAPSQETDPDKIHLPAFTIRTMDHAKVDVGVNGYLVSTTSCLWSVREGLEFDPKIPVPEWPPAGAKYVGVSRTGAHEAEVYIAPGADVNLPHLKNGEHVLYVKGKVGGAPLLGALRLYVGRPGNPYRYIVYNPMDLESEAAMRFSRTLWFESTKTE
jgi:hypothetical protein